MRAYFYDNKPGSQILAHDSGREVSQDTLRSLGVLYWCAREPVHRLQHQLKLAQGRSLMTLRVPGRTPSTRLP
jgi:hypothetical protein